jgi:hypothetical protein
MTHYHKTKDKSRGERKAIFHFQMCLTKKIQREMKEKGTNDEGFSEEKWLENVFH